MDNLVWNLNNVKEDIDKYGMDAALQFLEQLELDVQESIRLKNRKAIDETIGNYMDFARSFIQYLVISK